MEFALEESNPKAYHFNPQRWLSLFPNCTTNERLGCCLDGRPATPLPFLSDPCCDLKHKIAVWQGYALNAPAAVVKSLPG